MNMFADLGTDNSIEEQGDVLGSGGLFDSGAYPATCTMAYVETAASGAVGINYVFELAGGRDLRYTAWVKSGAAKGGKNYYEKNGQRHYLPGFTLANHIALLATNKELSELLDSTVEEKTISLFDYDAKKELPVKKQVIMGLIGTKVTLGVLLQKENKSVKNDAGTYVVTNDVRELNEIDKVFYADDGRTVAEIRAKAETATFKDQWVKKWDGQVKDRYKTVANAPAAGASVGGAAKPTASLFSTGN